MAKRTSGIVAALALTALGCQSAFAGGTMAFQPNADGSTSFSMPSGNIGCYYTPAGGTTTYMPEDGGPELSCDRVEPTYLRFVLGASGAATIIDNVGDAGCCSSDNPFTYGTTWRLEPFTCASDTKGLRCERDDGHGFFISRAKTEAY
jgi:hypothetical protein